MQLLRGLFESRVMTLAHAAVFHFGGSIEAATKRVQKLKAAGVIGERPRKVYEPSVLSLTRHALDLLAEHGVLADYPKLGSAALEKRARVSELTLRHELQVMNVRAAFWTALTAKADQEIETFCTWPLLCAFRAKPAPGHRDVVVRPDGYIRIREKSRPGNISQQVFFLELDRSTEAQHILATKAACYGDYYRRGGLAARSGRPRSEYYLFPFRVLIVCRNAERRNNAAYRMLQNRPAVRTQVWLTTYDEVIKDPLGPIWVQPVAYRDAVAGTGFFIQNASTNGHYVRHSERETWVESRVRKSSILNNDNPSTENQAIGSASVNDIALN